MKNKYRKLVEDVNAIIDDAETDKPQEIHEVVVSTKELKVIKEALELSDYYHGKRKVGK